MVLSDVELILIAGGGIIGCSIAYYLTQHPKYSLQSYRIVLLEACDIASAASGKSGGFVGAWATPSCLAQLSYDLHKKLADKYDGRSKWGYRACSGWNTTWSASTTGRLQESDADERSNSEHSQSPPGVDWLRPSVVEKFELLGKPSESAQINPRIFTRELASIAQWNGVEVIYGKANSLKYTTNGRQIDAVEYSSADGLKTLKVDDLVLAAGPWTTKLLPALKLGAPRSHSIVVSCPNEMNGNVIFPIEDQENSTTVTFPEIYPRPPDSQHSFPTVYTCGPDDYDDELPETSAETAVLTDKVEALAEALHNVSGLVSQPELILAKQACHKPQLAKHGEGEEVGPAVGPVDGIEGLWVATGHDEWGKSKQSHVSELWWLIVPQ